MSKIFIQVDSDDWGGYSSKEISRARDVNAIGDPDIDHWKESFQAEVIG